MRNLAETCEQIAGTSKKLEKIALVADYLKSHTPQEAAVSAVFLSGRAFPGWEETTLQVGGALLWRAVKELSGKSEQELAAAYRRHGDLGAVAAEVLPARQPGRDLGVFEVQERLRQMAAARGPAAKSALLRELLGQTTPLAAKYMAICASG
jgi:DNA ligase 1